MPASATYQFGATALNRYVEINLLPTVSYTTQAIA